MTSEELGELYKNIRSNLKWLNFWQKLLFFAYFIMVNLSIFIGAVMTTIEPLISVFCFANVLMLFSGIFGNLQGIEKRIKKVQKDLYHIGSQLSPDKNPEFFKKH